ncbi:MAG: serine/threonine protein kinase [Thermomicrobiales bacterium]|nr:serine/threonine protein kinase [Thermomicrobiales bacterium]
MTRTQAIINGRYRVGRRLGQGGMALVYAGHDLLLGRDVAIKTLRPEFASDPAFRARFEREARAAAALSHPNIIDIFDVGEEGGQPFIVMELVRGKSLREIIAAEAPFHPNDVAELLEQVGSALDYAHARGYVHRDIKPGNILVDEHGRARVVDFGIAKGLADADLTETGGGFGTVGYLSPEQAEGLMATPASDLYSMGVVAYEMLTGTLPFPAETPIGVAMRHVNDPAPPPSRARPAIPAQVDAVVLRALEKDPTRRWPSAGAFATALRNWRSASPPAQPPPMRVAPTPPSRGSRVPPLLAPLVVLVALAALLWAGFQGLPSNGNDLPATTIAPPTPAITGAIPEEDVLIIEAQPSIAPDVASEPTPMPTATAPAIAPAPTIAPVAASNVAVPDLRGQSMADATRALLPLGLRIALGQTEFSDSAPLNTVVSQDPPPDALVPPDTVVRVSLSRGPSPFGGRSGP